MEKDNVDVILTELYDAVKKLSASKNQKRLSDIHDFLKDNILPEVALKKYKISFKKASAASLATSIQKCSSKKITDSSTKVLQKFCEQVVESEKKIVAPSSLTEFQTARWIIETINLNADDIEWDTEDGSQKPNEFDWKSQPPSAIQRKGIIQQQIATFFKKQDVDQSQFALTCPPIYYKDGSKWKKCIENKSQEFDYDSLPLSVRKIFNSEFRFSNANPTTKEYQTYCAVVIDDFADKDFQVQLYYGKATNGTFDRWAGGGSAHCREAKKHLVNAQKGATSTSLQLIDLYLAYLWLHYGEDWKKKIFLFAVKTFKTADEMEDDEADIVRRFQLTNSRFGMNQKEGN